MNRILICLLLFCQLECESQDLDFRKIKQISYTNWEGDVFYLMNDSILVTNLNSNGDTAEYKILRDTVFSYQEYSVSSSGQQSVENITHYFVFKQLDNDTIKMTAYGYYDRNYHKEEVNYTFLSNKLLEKQVELFEYIIIERISPFWGYNKLKFRKDKVVEFYIDMKNVAVNYIQIDTFKTIKPAKKEISTLDYNNFLAALKKAKIITWPVNRYNCSGTDRSDINITLKVGGKFYYSLGCTIPYQFRELMSIYEFLLDRFIVRIKEN